MPSEDDPRTIKQRFTPCSPEDQGAIEMTWMDVKSGELLEPELTKYDFKRSISITKPTVNDADINQHLNFTNEFGQRG